jgi:hypothetical protein
MTRSISSVWTTLLFFILLAASTVACVTVKPQQRAILADPAMVFGGDPHAAAPITHVYQNREGSFGGEGVTGGGCGCN